MLNVKFQNFKIEQENKSSGFGLTSDERMYISFFQNDTDYYQLIADKNFFTYRKYSNQSSAFFNMWNANTGILKNPTNTIDILDINLDAGIYAVNNGNAINTPTDKYYYYFLEIIRDESNNWRLIKMIPTSLDCEYRKFYNGYGDGEGWSGWKTFSLSSL